MSDDDVVTIKVLREFITRIETKIDAIVQNYGITTDNNRNQISEKLDIIIADSLIQNETINKITRDMDNILSEAIITIKDDQSIFDKRLTETHAGFETHDNDIRTVVSNLSKMNQELSNYGLRLERIDQELRGQKLITENIFYDIDQKLEDQNSQIRGVHEEVITRVASVERSRSSEAYSPSNLHGYAPDPPTAHNSFMSNHNNRSSISNSLLSRIPRESHMSNVRRSNLYEPPRAPDRRQSQFFDPGPRQYYEPEPPVQPLAQDRGIQIIPPFNKYLKTVSLQDVTEFLHAHETHVNTYALQQKPPPLGAFIPYSLAVRLLSLHGRKFSVPYDPKAIATIPNATIKAMLLEDLRPRTRDAFLEALKMPLRQVTPVKSTGTADFECAMSNILSGLEEFQDRLTHLYDETNVNLCPNFDDKTDGIINIFFKIISHSLNFDYARRTWNSKVDRNKKKELIDSEIMTPIEKFEAFKQLLRDQMKSDFREANNSALAKFLADDPVFIRSKNRTPADSQAVKRPSHLPRTGYPRRSGLHNMDQSYDETYDHYDNFSDEDDNEFEPLPQNIPDDQFELDFHAVMGKPAFQKPLTPKPAPQGCHRMARTGKCDQAKCSFSHDPAVLRETANAMLRE